MVFSSLTPASSRLVHQLRAAQDEHDGARRNTMDGVSAPMLNADNARWEEIGAAMAALARLIHARCASSPFCGARPSIEALAARLSESIDDQIDGPAWRVIDAAARWGAVEAR